MGDVPQNNWQTRVESEVEKYMSSSLPFWDVIVFFTENKVLLKKGVEPPKKIDCRLVPLVFGARSYSVCCSKLWSLFQDKKEAISSGFALDGIHYDIHR